jgi:hypothetical protein
MAEQGQVSARQTEKGDGRKRLGNAARAPCRRCAATCGVCGAGAELSLPGGRD